MVGSDVHITQGDQYTIELAQPSLCVKQMMWHFSSDICTSGFNIDFQAK